MTMFELFYLNVHKDEDLAVQCLQSFHRHYPEVPILAIADGLADESRLTAVMDMPGFELIQGEPLKYHGHNKNVHPQHIKRNLTAVLERTQGRVIKLDPASYVWRKARYCPDSYWAGTVTFGHQANTFSQGLRMCNGGGWMMRTEAMEEILKSGLLDHKFLRNPFISGEDPVYGWGMEQLEISPVAWAEVISSRRKLENEAHQWAYQFAITHPVKGVFSELDHQKQAQPA